MVLKNLDQWFYKDNLPITLEAVTSLVLNVIDRSM